MLTNFRKCLTMINQRGLIASFSAYQPSVVPKRDFRASRIYDPNDTVDYEISKNPIEWEYVSRLLPVKIVPKPVPKSSYPSGWKPQNPEAIEQPYYIRRSRNHMLPVYLDIGHRGMRKRTYVKNVLGDIWQFASELHKYLESKSGLPIGYKVDELGCKVVFRGDFHYYASQFLISKGF